MVAKRKARPGQWPKLMNLPKNWMAQGMVYMDCGERTVRLMIEIVMIGVVFLLLQSSTKDSVGSLWSGALAAITVHTVNWVFNGNFVALCLFAFPQLKNRGEAQTLAYLNSMAERLSQAHSITAVLVYGSVARRAWHDRSDVDIRILRRCGVVNLLAAWGALTKERILALINWQPIDLYLADDVDFLARMRADEEPVLLLMRDDRLSGIHPFDKSTALKALR